MQWVLRECRRAEGTWPGRGLMEKRFKGLVPLGPSAQELAGNGDLLALVPTGHSPQRLGAALASVPFFAEAASLWGVSMSIVLAMPQPQGSLRLPHPKN